ncbi:unnamed protein product [Closterium sp. NIES-54]
MTRGCERLVTSLTRRVARCAQYGGGSRELTSSAVSAVSSFRATWQQHQICQPRQILAPSSWTVPDSDLAFRGKTTSSSNGIRGNSSNSDIYACDYRQLPVASWCSQHVGQPISTSPVATWRGGDGSHPAKFQHTFVPPPAVPPSAGFAFVPRFTALRGEWPSPSPLPATQPSAQAAARRGKEGGGSRRQSRGKGGSVGAEGAAAGAARGEGEQASIGDEEAYLEDGAWEEGNREEDEDAAVPPSALPAARQAACALPAPSSSPLLPASSLPLPRPPPPSMLVVQPRPHPRWLLRAKLGEALRLVDSLTGTDSQWEMEQRSWGGAGGGEAADAVWWGQDSQQRRGGAREWQGEGAQWQGEGEQWRQGEEAEAEWRRRSEKRGMRGNGVEGRGRSGDGVEGFGFPPPGGGHPWVVVHSRGRGICAGMGDVVGGAWLGEIGVWVWVWAIRG